MSAGPPLPADLWAASSADHAAGLGETCAVLMATANEVVRPVHWQVPAIVAPADFATWLDPCAPAAELYALLRPYLIEARGRGAGGAPRRQAA
jgi:putative SOS response-associated peptidase YedK